MLSGGGCYPRTMPNPTQDTDPKRSRGGKRKLFTSTGAMSHGFPTGRASFDPYSPDGVQVSNLDSYDASDCMPEPKVHHARNAHRASKTRKIERVTVPAGSLSFVGYLKSQSTEVH